MGLRRFCVAGVGQCALPGGRMYALASLWRPFSSAAFAWQAWDNVHCQGVSGVPWAPPLLRGRRGTISIAKGSDVRPWRPSGVPWAPPLLRGSLATMCTARWSDVRPGVPLASLGLRRFCVAGVSQSPLPRGRMYVLASLWRPLGSAAFAWQACDNLHCQGVGCTPWRPSGVPWAPPLLRGRRGTMCTARGSDVAGVGQCALPGGLWRPLGSAAFAWQAWGNLHCQGVGCTPWRPSGVPWAPPLLRGRLGTMCTARWSDVRRGVPLASLGLRRF